MKDFATKPFDEVKSHYDGIIRKYYSCWPLLFQIGILFMNYTPIVEDEDLKRTVIKEAKELFTRVKEFDDNIELQQLALHSEAICELTFGNASNVLSILESKVSYTLHPKEGQLKPSMFQLLAVLIVTRSLLIS